MSKPNQAVSRSAGFSIVEVLTVIGLIGILLAIAIPFIYNYFRTYRIRTGVTEVLAALQQARATAIKKNVNVGVVFLVQNPTTYWTHLEDNQALPRTNLNTTLDMDTPVPTQSTRGQLPRGIVFGAAGDCPGFAPNDTHLRFNRLGAWCDPGTTNCPNIATPTGTVGGNAIQNSADGTVVCLRDTELGLNQIIRIAPGGRILQPQ